jgi:hypothetical protein
MGRRCVSPHIIYTLPLILAIRNRATARIHMLLYHLRKPLSSLSSVHILALIISGPCPSTSSYPNYIRRPPTFNQ